MARFIIRRLIGMVLVLFAVSVITFLIFNVIPNGDPAVRMAGKNSTGTQIQAIRETWGFNDSLPQQYVNTMKQVFSGDLISYVDQTNVWEEIRKGMPRTFALAIGAAILWMSFAVALGKHWKIVLAVVLAITVLLGIGLTQVEFATGQDSYLNSDSQIAIDNREFQNYFGGEAVILLFTANEPGVDVADLFTGDNLATLQQINEDLESIPEVESVVSPLTLALTTR